MPTRLPRSRKRRPRVRISATVDPAVARAFKSVCRRYKWNGCITERLIFAFIMSDPATRIHLVVGGAALEAGSHAERYRMLRELAEEIRERQGEQGG